MSDCFPRWIAADIILRGLVYGKFGLQVTMSYNDYSSAANLSVGFFKPEDLSCIPPEDTYKFEYLYRKFSTEIMQEIGISEISLDFLYKPYSKETKEAIKRIVTTRLTEYEQKKGRDLKDIFLEDYLHIRYDTYLPIV